MKSRTEASECTDRCTGHILTKQEGKCCHSIGVLKKYYPTVSWLYKICYTKISELVTHKNTSAEVLPIDFPFFLMCRTGLLSSYLELLQKKQHISALHTFSQALEQNPAFDFQVTAEDCKTIPEA